MLFNTTFLSSYEIFIMTNRNRTEIISQILQVTSDFDKGNGVTRTAIMYRVFLNTTQIKEYLPILTTYGLLSYDAVIRRFRITGKGLQFLKIYDNLGIMTNEEKEYIFH